MFMLRSSPHVAPFAPQAQAGLRDQAKIEYKNLVLRLNRYFDGETTGDEAAISRRRKMLGEALCKIWTSPVSIQSSSPLDKQAELSS